MSYRHVHKVPILLSLCLSSLLCSACGKTGQTDLLEAGQPRAQELKAQAGDVTLHVRIAGDPQADNVLIAVHGGPGMSSHYMASLEQLVSPELAVVTYDQRGAGRSTAPPDDASNYALLKYASDLEAVRKAVGAERVHVLGHSWGGIVAMRYATLHPQKVRSIVLMGSGPPSLQAARAGQARRAQRIAVLQQQGVIPRALSTVNDILPAYFSDPRFGLPAELRDLHYNETAERLTWSALGDYDFTSQVAELNHPVLMVWGADDPCGLPMAEFTRKAMSAAQVEFVVLQDCGHFWQECPDPFFSHVRAFLGLSPTP